MHRLSCACIQVVEAASDANKAYEEENERLREELEAAQEQLAAVKQQQASLTTVHYIITPSYAVKVSVLSSGCLHIDETRAFLDFSKRLLHVTAMHTVRHLMAAA